MLGKMASQMDCIVISVELVPLVIAGTTAVRDACAVSGKGRAALSIFSLGFRVFRVRGTNTEIEINKLVQMK